jgi:hypothetical protein
MHEHAPIVCHNILTLIKGKGTIKFSLSDVSKISQLSYFSHFSIIYLFLSAVLHYKIGKMKTYEVPASESLLVVTLGKACKHTTPHTTLTIIVLIRFSFLFIYFYIYLFCGNREEERLYYME